MFYERPVVRLLGMPHSFQDFLLGLRSFDVSISSDWRVQRLKNLIDDNPARVRWNLDQLSEQLGLQMSGRQARRLFKESFGMGIKEYAKKKRLEVAAQQLRTTDVPVKAIAIDAGYLHVGNFTRSFLKHFRLCPIEFRRLLRETNTKD